MGRQILKTAVVTLQFTPELSLQTDGRQSKILMPFINVYGLYKT
jgi:hypothetical protein